MGQQTETHFAAYPITAWDAEDPTWSRSSIHNALGRTNMLRVICIEKGLEWLQGDDCRKAVHLTVFKAAILHSAKIPSG